MRPPIGVREKEDYRLAGRSASLPLLTCFNLHLQELVIGAQEDMITLHQRMQRNQAENEAKREEIIQRLMTKLARQKVIFENSKRAQEMQFEKALGAKEAKFKQRYIFLSRNVSIM